MSIVTANEQRVHGLVKVASHLFGSAEMDFYRGEQNDIYMTAEQIGRALEYSNAQISVLNIFNRNRDRLEANSVLIDLISTDGKTYGTRLFNERGIYEIIRKSGQPKADRFYDWVYDVLQAIRKTGSYSIHPVPDERQLRVQMLKTVLEHEASLSEIGQRLERVERSTTLDHGEQRRLQKSIANRVCALVSDEGKKRECFKQLHRDIRDRWGVASYRDVRRVELDEVLAFTAVWKPRIV